MIYLDTSVLLADVRVENRRPDASLWRQDLVSSRLIAVETWCALHRNGEGDRLGPYAAALLDRIDQLDLTPAILEAAQRPLLRPLRTLDALHLVTLLEVNRQVPCALASYDTDMMDCATTYGIELADTAPH